MTWVLWSTWVVTGIGAWVVIAKAVERLKKIYDENENSGAEK